MATKLTRREGAGAVDHRAEVAAVGDAGVADGEHLGAVVAGSFVSQTAGLEPTSTGPVAGVALGLAAAAQPPGTVVSAQVPPVRVKRTAVPAGTEVPSTL
ncbi:MAG: hypothetical protein PGN11_17315 [Quadrisphaera sp.]